MKTITLPLVILTVALSGCLTLGPRTGSPCAMLRINFLVIDVSLDTAEKAGLVGIPATPANDSSLPQPIPSILSPTQSKAFISFLKAQKETNIVATASIVQPDGKTAIVRNVTELYGISSSPQDGKQDSLDSLITGSRFEATARYNAYADTIDIRLDTMHSSPTDDDAILAYSFDVDIDISLKNGYATIAAQQIPLSTRSVETTSYPQRLSLLLVSAEKIGKSDLSRLEREIRAEQSRDEQENNLNVDDLKELDASDDDFEEMDERWADEYVFDAPGLERELTKLSVLCLETPLNLTPFWSGASPSRPENPNGYLNHEQASRLYSQWRKQGAKIVYSNSRVAKTGTESLIRDVAEFHSPRSEETLELGVISRIAPFVSETTPKSVSFEFNPILQFRHGDSVTAATMETILAIPDGHYVVLENGSKTAQNHLLFIIGAQNQLFDKSNDR